MMLLSIKSRTTDKYRTHFGVPRNFTKNIGEYDMGKNKIITNKHNGGNKYILKKEPKVL